MTFSSLNIKYALNCDHGSLKEGSKVYLSLHNASPLECLEPALDEYSHWLTRLGNMAQELFQNRTSVFLVLFLKLCKPKGGYNMSNLSKHN